MPPRATVRGSLRRALTDFYFNSIPLVAANIVWGIGVILTLGVATASPLLALLLAIALALPTAGIFRLATVIARDEPASFSDAMGAWRLYPRPALMAGALVVGCAIVLGFNFVIGILSGNLVLLMIGTLAAWGLVVLFMGVSAFWPVLLDPARQQDPIRTKVKVALAVVFVAPGRYLGLSVVIAFVLIVSTVAFAALLTISIAFVALTLCRYVLPTADRLEGRATFAEPILD